MALFRPCRRLARTLVKSIISHQTDYIRVRPCTARTQDYVIVTPRFNCPNASIEKSEIFNDNNVPANEYSRADTIKQLSRAFRYTINREVPRKTLLRILKTGKVDNDNVTDNSVGLEVLRCCGDAISNLAPADRRKLTAQVWNLIEELLPIPSLQHYNDLLTVYTQNSEIVDPENFLKNMKVPADSETYRLLISCVAKSGNVKAALYVLSLMKKISFSLDESILNSLVEVYARNGDVESALENIQTMRNFEIQPSSLTWTNLACGYAKIGDIQEVKTILSSKKLEAVRILEIATCLSLSGHGEQLPAVLEFFPSDANFTDTRMVEITSELVYAGKPEDSYVIVDRITRNESTEERDRCLLYYLSNLVRANTPIATLLDVTNRLAKTKKYSSAVTIACKKALSSGKSELSMALFERMREQMIDVRPHYYWPLLLQATRNEGEAQVFRTIKHMISLEVRLDHDTLCDYVFPFVNTADPVCTIRKFDDMGVPTSVIVTPLLSYTLTRGDFSKSLVLSSRYKSLIKYSQIIEPLTIAYKIHRDVVGSVEVLKHAPQGKNYPEKFLMILYGKLPSDKNTPEVEKFLRTFHDHNIRVGNFRETVKTRDGRKVERLVNPLDNREASFEIPHPSEMTIDELECHLIELTSKGMNTRGILRKLLMLHCSENNLKRVNEIKAIYNDHGFLWTAGMYSTLLSLHLRMGSIEEARNLYKELRTHHADFKIDGFKIVQLATGLVKSKNIDEAIEILESSPCGTPMVSKECWNLLNAVVHSEYSEMTERFLDVLVNGNYCDKTNAIVGPLVRQHILKNDLTKAVDVFKRLAEKHGVTPLRMELINALLKSMRIDENTRDNAIKLIEDVRIIVTKIYGRGEFIVDLFVGLASNGMSKELRNFFESNYVNENSLASRLQQMGDNDRAQILTEILDSCFNLPNPLRTMVYEQLLSVHSRSGDCQGAIELWRRAFKENGTISRNFNLNLLSLLKSHNVPFPEDFEVR